VIHQFLSRPLFGFFDLLTAPSRPLTAPIFSRPQIFFYGHFWGKGPSPRPLGNPGKNERARPALYQHGCQVQQWIHLDEHSEIESAGWSWMSAFLSTTIFWILYKYFILAMYSLIFSQIRLSWLCSLDKSQYLSEYLTNFLQIDIQVCLGSVVLASSRDICKKYNTIWDRVSWLVQYIGLSWFWSFQCFRAGIILDIRYSRSPHI